MDIKETFVNVQPREFSGQNTFRSYRFQCFFAANLLLKMAKEKNKDGLLLLDYFDDVVFLDSEENPSLINFYQVKTNKECKITISSMITNNFIQKMGWNLEQFKECNCCSIFVSNGSINVNFGHAKGDLHIKDYQDFEHSCLKEISVTNVLKSHEMNEESLAIIKKYLPEGVKTDQILFLKTDFSLDNFENDFLGKIVNFFSDKCSTLDAVGIKAIADTLINRLEEKQSSPFNPTVLSYGEIISKKGFQVGDFESIVNKTIQHSVPNDFADLFDFCKNVLDYTFDDKNILFLSQQYSQFKIDYVKNMNTYQEIVEYLISVDFTEITNSNLFAYFLAKIKESDIYNKSLFCSNYDSLIIAIYLYKNLKGNVLWNH